MLDSLTCRLCGGDIQSKAVRVVMLTTLQGVCARHEVTMSEFSDCEYFKCGKESPKEEPVT